MNVTEYLQQASGIALQVDSGVWVRLTNNTTGTSYVSAAITDSSGKFTVSGVPIGSYTISTGPTSAGPWTGTGQGNYIVASDGSAASVPLSAVSGALRRFVPSWPVWLPQQGTAASQYSVAYRETVLADRPVAYWRLDDGGTTAWDFTGNNNTGTLNGTITKGVAGALTNDTDTAMTFDGATGYISVPNALALHPGDIFSLECWYKRTSAVGGQTMMASGTNGWQLSIYSGQITLTKENAATCWVSTANTYTDTGTWHHLVVVKNGGTTSVYVDGRSIAGTLTNQTMANSGGPVTLGAKDATPASEYWNGSLDEVAIYDIPLIQQQVVNHYNMGKGMYPHADAPVQTAYGPGAASPITSPTTVAYNSTTSVAFLGCKAVTVTDSNAVSYTQNQINGQTGAGAGPWAIEFDYYGQDLAIRYRLAANTDPPTFWVWVNGKPVSATTSVTASGTTANVLYYYRLTWSTVAHRRVRVYMSQCDYGGIDIGPTDTCAAAAHPGYTIAILGDSYVAGATNGVSRTDTWAFTFARMIGAEIYECGLGGTGYSQVNGGSPVYGDTTRVNPITAVAPNEIWICGSTNDSGFSSTTVSTAAKACWAALIAGSPNSTIRVFGVQAISGTMSAANIANNTALKNAATAAGYTFIDPINEGWITGTGHVGALTGSGNADVFIGADGIHPTQDGHYYYARRVYDDFVAALSAT